MINPIKISIPNDKEFIGISRLNAAYIAAHVGFDLETVEDIKLAVGEAVNNAIVHSTTQSSIDITFSVNENGIDITVADKGIGFSTLEYQSPNLDHLNEGGLGIFIIRSLMDKVEIVSQEGIGTTMKMSKYTIQETING